MNTIGSISDLPGTPAAYALMGAPAGPSMRPMSVSQTIFDPGSSNRNPSPIKPGDLLGSLGNSSAPCAAEEFRTRFDQFVREMVHGKDVSKIRIVIEKDD